MSIIQLKDIHVDIIETSVKSVSNTRIVSSSYITDLSVDVYQSYFPCDVGVASKHSFVQNNPAFFYFIKFIFVNSLQK